MHFCFGLLLFSSVLILPCVVRWQKPWRTGWHTVYAYGTGLCSWVIMPKGHHKVPDTQRALYACLRHVFHHCHIIISRWKGFDTLLRTSHNCRNKIWRGTSAPGGCFTSKQLLHVMPWWFQLLAMKLFGCLHLLSLGCESPVLDSL